jgi:hypothetical protein
MRSATSLLALLLCPSLTLAQWTSNPAANTVAVDRAGEQTQTKMVARPDGGFYLSWFDNDAGGTPAFGYDVYLQRFDSAGNEMWAHNGVLVADRGFSSTTDYDLSIDSSGNALLAFRDDRPGGTQITAAKIDETGAHVWGAGGIQLTATASFVANPEIAGTTDGHAVVAWIQDADVRVQRLDSTGTATWSPDVVLTPATGSYSTADLAATDAGTVILSLVHGTGGFSAPRYLRAQKFNAAGSPLWGATPLAVYDGGSLQIGNYPDFVTDGAGGAVFAWYSASPALESFAQHIDSGGTEQFPHNGVSVSTNAAQLRVSPAVAFDPVTGSTWVACVESNSTQSLWGVTAQRYDASGNRQMGATGLVLVPLGAASTAHVTATALGSNLLATWVSSPAFSQDVALGAVVEPGAAVTPVSLATTPSTKYRFSAAATSFGYAAIAWRDERGADPDIYIQNVLPSGALGGLASSVIRNGSGVNGLFYTPVTEPRIGHAWVTDVEHAHHPGALVTVLQIRTTPVTGPVFGFGQALIAGPKLLVQQLAATGTSNTHSILLPADINLVGYTVYTQAGIIGGGLELANAIDITLGL